MKDMPKNRLHDIKGNICGSARILIKKAMIVRILFLCLIAASVSTRASEPIAAPGDGKSATVSQPHVTAELIPERTTVQPGQPFDIILHLHSDPGWHTYWINPGDAGLATSIKWTLPPGFTAGPIQWPTPEKHNMGPLITYGYEGDVYLLTTITPPKADLPKHFDVKANAQWLVCKEECIPGHADLALTFDTQPLNLRLPVENKDFFEQARERVPVANTLWDVKGAYGTPPELGGMAPEALEIMLTNKAGIPTRSWGSLHFFVEQSNVLDSHGEKFMSDPKQKTSDLGLWITLQQNGEKPDELSGVLVSDQPLIGKSHAVYLSAFSTKNAPNEAPTMSAAAAAAAQQNEAQLPGQGRSQVQLGNEGKAVYISEFPVATEATAASGQKEAQLPGQARSQVQLGNEGNIGDGHRPPLQGRMGVPHPPRVARTTRCPGCPQAGQQEAAGKLPEEILATVPSTSLRTGADRRYRGSFSRFWGRRLWAD